MTTQKLELRKAINSKLRKLIHSKSKNNKTKLRVLISKMENKFNIKFGYKINYNWE